MHTTRTWIAHGNSHLTCMQKNYKVHIPLKASLSIKGWRLCTLYLLACTFEDVRLVGFTCMPGGTYSSRFRSLLCSCDVFRAPINWFPLFVDERFRPQSASDYYPNIYYVYYSFYNWSKCLLAVDLCNEEGENSKGFFFGGEGGCGGFFLCFFSFCFVSFVWVFLHPGRNHPWTE